MEGQLHLFEGVKWRLEEQLCFFYLKVLKAFHKKTQIDMVAKLINFP